MNMLFKNNLRHFQIPQAFIRMGYHRILNASALSLYYVICSEVQQHSNVTRRISNRDLAVMTGIRENKIGATRAVLVKHGLIYATKCPQAFEYTLSNPSTQQPLVNSIVNGESIEVVYSYMDELDEVSFQVVRHGNKKFFMRRPHPDTKGEWIHNTHGCPDLVYRLPDVKEADVVIVTEGERDVEAIFKMRLWDDADQPIAATTNPKGSGQWMPAHSAFLKGKLVFICGDNDAAGRSHVVKVRESLEGVASEMVIISLPTEYKDISEFMEVQNQEEFLKLVGDDRLQMEKVYL
jgi:hypothetical protein